MPLRRSLDIRLQSGGGRFTLKKMRKLSDKYLDMILARMKSEGIKDLSDAEIERVFRETVMPNRLIALTKECRDKGIITLGTGIIKFC